MYDKQEGGGFLYAGSVLHGIRGRIPDAVRETAGGDAGCGASLYGAGWVLSLSGQRYDRGCAGRCAGDGNRTGVQQPLSAGDNRVGNR